MPGKKEVTKTATEAVKKTVRKTRKTVRRVTTKPVRKTAPKTVKTAKRDMKGKKPLTPYFAFAQEKREELKKTLQAGEKINEKLSSVWKSMSEEEKKPYMEQYRKGMEEREEKYKERIEKNKERLAVARDAKKKE